MVANDYSRRCGDHTRYVRKALSVPHLSSQRLEGSMGASDRAHSLL